MFLFQELTYDAVVVIIINFLKIKKFPKRNKIAKNSKIIKLHYIQ